MFDLFVIYVSPTAEVPRGFSWRMVRRSRPPLLRHCPAGAWALCGGRGAHETRPGSRGLSLCVAVCLFHSGLRRPSPAGRVSGSPPRTGGGFRGSRPYDVICTFIFHHGQRRQRSWLQGPRPRCSDGHSRFGTKDVSSRGSVCVTDHGHGDLLCQ